MMDFKEYYAALLRHGHQSEPRADEALRDYQSVLKQLVLAGVM
jgi:hypothetical protein